MSKEQATMNKMADTAVVTENPDNKQDLRRQLEQVQQDNAKLREQLHLVKQDIGWIARYLEDRTIIRLADIRNLIKALSYVIAKDRKQI